MESIFSQAFFVIVYVCGAIVTLSLLEYKGGDALKKALTQSKFMTMAFVGVTWWAMIIVSTYRALRKAKV